MKTQSIKKKIKSQTKKDMIKCIWWFIPVYKNKHVRLKCACNFTISYTYPPLATQPTPQIVAFRIKCVPNMYIGNVIYVKLIYIIAGVTWWYQLCQCINEIVEYKYIFISSLHIFWQLQPIIGIGLCKYPSWMAGVTYGECIISEVNLGLYSYGYLW